MGFLRKMFFWGFDEIVDFFWVITKLVYLGGHFYTFKGFFLRSRYRIGIFLGLLNFKYFFWFV